LAGSPSLVSRIAVTFVIFLLASFVAWRLWVYYLEAPWTRDGKIRADFISVAPDVSGLVSQVLVHENDQVKKGEILFRIDPDRFSIAILLARARVSGAMAVMDEAGRNARRYHQLMVNGDATREVARNMEARFEKSRSDYQEAMARLSIAILDQKRADVRARVNGKIANMTLEPGDYVHRGEGVLSLVDTDSLHVDGYFEETKLSRIHIGDPVEVRVMGDHRSIWGHVSGIAGGIRDRERHEKPGDPPDVNPTFSWVRLAQRIPVRVHLDKIPEGLRLVSGRTVTVIDRKKPLLGKMIP
jgi:multidrug resistance efflux pump